MKIFHYTKYTIVIVARSLFAGAILFSVFRILFSFKTLSYNDFAIYSVDYFSALLAGFKFDMMVLCYLFLLPLLFLILSVFISHLQNRLRAVAKGLIIFVLFLVSFICIIDYFYYDYFQTHINVLAFGLFEDDTHAVLTSVWSDYPVIRILLLLILLFIFIEWIVNTIFRHATSSLQPPASNPRLRTSIFILLFLGLYALGMRGSLGTFPLQIDDATVSENAKINLLPINGVYAIKEAFRTRKLQKDFVNDLTIVKSFGYDDAQKAVADYLDISFDSVKNNPDFFNLLFSTTATDSFKEKNPPNVVFFQMESMSNYNLNYHSPTLNLYGALEKHAGEDYFLRNFLSYANGTINSLEGLMVNTPVTSLAQSQFRYRLYNSSVAKPFVENGYETTYITGGKLGWRNIDEFIPRQYFNNVESKNNVVNKYKNATECEWGVYDEYLFDYVYDKLKDAKEKPQMIFAMTTTNHTPFNIPSHFKPNTVQLPDSVKSILLTTEEIAVKNLTTFQYSNDCLGKFMDKIKNSPLAKNTIVAASGDHNNLMLFSFSENEVAQKLGVPLYMYVPEEYKSGKTMNKNRWASHRDIFPTLINLSLSGISYFNSGHNLFDNAFDLKNSFAINYGSMMAINDSGSVMFVEPAQFYLHDKISNNSASAKENEALKQLSKRARAYYAAMYYYIRNEAKR